MTCVGIYDVMIWVASAQEAIAEAIPAPHQMKNITQF